MNLATVFVVLAVAAGGVEPEAGEPEGAESEGADPRDDGETEDGAAEAQPSLEELDGVARDAYEARDYATAVSAFERAHAMTGDANYLFNIGRVYEESGDLEQAVTFYERFLDAGEVSLESRRVTLDRLEVLREVLASRERAKRAGEEPPPAPAPPPDDVGLVPTGGQPADLADQQRRRKLKIAGAVLAGIGGAGVVAGAVMGGLAQRQASVLDDESVALEDRRRRINAANTYAVAADGLFISGGVVAATGLALIIASVAGRRRASSSAHSLRWTAFAHRHQALLRLHGRF